MRNSGLYVMSHMDHHFLYLFPFPFQPFDAFSFLKPLLVRIRTTFYWWAEQHISTFQPTPPTASYSHFKKKPSYDAIITPPQPFKPNMNCILIRVLLPYLYIGHISNKGCILLDGLDNIYIYIWKFVRLIIY